MASVKVVDGRPRTIWLRSDANGMFLERDEQDGRNGTGYTNGDPREVHYYIDGIGVGDISNNGTSDVDYATSISRRGVASQDGAFRNGSIYSSSYADFDQSYDPINGLSYETTSSRYTVKDGDTLEGIAQRLWGDASYWYLIAEANGLTGAESLLAGQSLTIPNKVHNSRNNADVYRVYDPNEIIGSTSPTNPKAPKKKNGCGAFGQILMVAVAVAVSVIAPVGGAGLGAALANAALASVASQGVGIAAGVQKGFSFKSLALSVVTAGVMKGISSTGFFSSSTASGSFAAGSSGIKNAALAMGLQGVAGNVITQGISVAAGLQSRFNWAGVATAGIGAGVASAIGGGDMWERAASGMAGGLAAAAGESLITGNSFGDTLMSSLPSIIGNTIGNLAADSVSRPRLGYADVGSDDGVVGGTQNNPSAASGVAATSGGNSAAVAAAINADQRQRTEEATDSDAAHIIVTATEHGLYDSQHISLAGFSEAERLAKVNGWEPAQENAFIHGVMHEEQAASDRAMQDKIYNSRNAIADRAVWDVVVATNPLSVPTAAWRFTHGEANVANGVEVGAALLPALKPLAKPVGKLIGKSLAGTGRVIAAETEVAQITLNAAKGRAFEEAGINGILSHVGLGKNTTAITRNGVTTILDSAGRPAGLVEFKDVANLSSSPQLRAQLAEALATRQPYNLVVSPGNKTISGPLLNQIRAVNRQVGGGVYRYDPVTDILIPWVK